MSKTIKIQILHALAISSAKNETYQKGVVEKAADPKLVAAAFHEQAGNETYHEAMLKRFLFTQIEKLKTYFADYLTGEGLLSQDATIDSSEADGVTTILLSVSDRFNDGYVKTLARLSQKYVEDRMIHLWWVPVSKDFATLYAGVAEDDIAAILNCFHKTAPKAPSYQWPASIIVSFPIMPTRNGIPFSFGPNSEGVNTPEILFGNPWLMGIGDNTEITYEIVGENGEAVMDDVVVRADNGCCQPFLTQEGRWALRACCKGHTIVTLFSRHNDNVFAKFAVRITDV